MDREVDDRRRDILGDRRLVQDHADLSGLQVVRRLELDDDGLVPEYGLEALGRAGGRRRVIAREVSAIPPVKQPVADDQRDASDEKQQARADRQRIDVEGVLWEEPLPALEEGRRNLDGVLLQRDRG